MLKAYKYRLYPNKNQKILIEKHFGCVRYIYNKSLETKIKAYQESNTSLSCINLINGLLMQEKEQHDWLQEVYSQSLQMSIRNLDNAFKRFFKQHKGFPNFKKKCSNQSVQFPQGVKIINNHVYLPKIGEVSFVQDRQFFGKIKTVTISKTSTNKYFVSILVDNEKTLPSKPKVEESTVIGLDLGLKSYIVTSNGDKVDNPKFLKKSRDRLKVLQRRASHKVLGSKNRSKANLRVTKLHERIKNQRNDFLHKLSSKIVRENQTICIEDLSVENMLKNHSLAQAIGDASWRTFTGMLSYKSEWYGKNLVKIGRYEASTKICSVCGNVNRGLTLGDREWVCESCKTVHDRDVNAAINIKKFGLITYSKRYTRQELPEELSELSGSQKR
ncbi:MAG: IS200/IS605 family element RNA-guided endonuclease TnpB [Nitrosarchaeum sp.]|nr:IS200/IS605 family element RNA-guided endonuclease TnpB [Nitrosarchaeum sp.]